jgi:hypothetical protein
MKTGRITVPGHGGRSYAFPLPGMLEPFFETGGLGRRGGRLVPGDPQETTGPGPLPCRFGPPALAISGAGHRVTGRAAPWGQAGACPYFLPEGP